MKIESRRSSTNSANGAFKTFDDKKTRNSSDWSIIIFLVSAFFLITLLFYLLLFHKFDRRKILDNYERMARDLVDGPLGSLLNGSGINNIPRLNLVSTNPEVVRANNCAKGPVYIGEGSATDADCVRTCVNADAHVVNVGEGETVVYQSTILQKGAHCVLGPRPECNMKTSVAMMTINSVRCVSRFPRLVGGSLGTTVLACNNNQVNDPQNVLWDFLTNTRFDPWYTDFTDPDERLPDGQFRFRCHYNGVDVRENFYQEHPLDRLHPIRNYCASALYRAHPDVKTLWSKDGKTFQCDCGDVKNTRVSHLDPNDSSSICASVSSSVTEIDGFKKVLNIPYRCFTLYSTLDDVGQYVPCPNDQFTREGSQWNQVAIELTENSRALIEHPLYADFVKADRDGSGVRVMNDEQVN